MRHSPTWLLDLNQQRAQVETLGGKVADKSEGKGNTKNMIIEPTREKLNSLKMIKNELTYWHTVNFFLFDTSIGY
ncbi:hypothetical protein DSM106972_075480 [Dulcicalothrix desertica PCC 7102]|uniref:Uncharacterized protein n=1 Tax=Dulcicalothrix desertica PCC 7102 TaxID=232991 RepID=A0A3S1AGS3_9CYAN|nr:hypothetical protein [Dulcicalothrix desertica]RUT00420.1 hypothetical protein DSM106972_075480 [Dulcicalothrix desertica PCC 7102]TWH42526.1 hypothetical protein CAL7102_06189 [Dulcicalothrix desertica PCC 7102]